MESLALEVPVVGTSVRGTRDLLEDGRGVLVPVGDIEQLARAFEWIIRHPSEARVMAQRGREYVTSCDLQRVLDAHERLYAEAVDSRSAQT